MVDFYQDILRELLPEYRVFKKRYARLRSALAESSDKEHLEALRGEFDELIRVLKNHRTSSIN